MSVTLCVGAYSGNPGDVCADIAPLIADGMTMSSQHAGSHMAVISPGSIVLEGPSQIWTIEEDWAGFSVVVNHWPLEKTQDVTCAETDCEHDDWLEIPFE